MPEDPKISEERLLRNDDRRAVRSADGIDGRFNAGQSASGAASAAVGAAATPIFGGPDVYEVV